MHRNSEGDPMSGFKYEKDADGIVVVTMDMPGEPVNTMNAAYEASMEETLKRLESESGEVAGVILTSGKSSFFAGGDLKALVAVEPAGLPRFFAMVERQKAQLRRFETLGKPVVAAINGAAMGGGLEIALACHRRIALDQPGVRLGLPEVTLGLMPGCGGVVRLVRMIGLEKALPLLTEGTILDAAAAKAAGIVDELASDVDDMLARAKAWIRANPASRQPFDVKGYRIPGGSASNPALANLLAMAPAALFKKTRGLLPAPARILAVAAESTLVDVDTALRIESRGITRLITTAQAKNLIQTYFFGINAIRSGESRPRNIPRARVSRLGILGAGMMGQGIAYVAAKAGIEVVLKDVTRESAEKGKSYSARLLDKAIERGAATPESRSALLGRITTTTEASDLRDCDLIVEAVFEDMVLKGRVTREAEPHLKSGGIFASNTSTLPITALAGASAQPRNFIGIHFFSPVDRMPLVEIINGEQTSDETLARAFDFAQQLGKTPIVVNDSRGFFTSRVFGTYLDEGCRLLVEGVDPQLIESYAMQAGMPVGPLAVHDEISQQLTQAVGVINRKLDEERQQHYCATAIESTRVANRMVDEFGRRGKAHRAGFYDYADDGTKRLWPRLAATFAPPSAPGMPKEDVQDRLLFRQVVEALHCLQEGVFRNLRDGNVGSIMGIGFPTHTGGVFQYINTYGLRQFLARCEALEARYGARFKPPQVLVDRARSGEAFL